MKITRRQLRSLVFEACNVCARESDIEHQTGMPEIDHGKVEIDNMNSRDAFIAGFIMGQSEDLDDTVDPPTVEDAFYPEEVEAREDAWAGGDNIEDPLDHSNYETGESNSGPHTPVSRCGVREMKITKKQLRKIIKEELGRLNESLDTSLNRKDAEYAYDNLAVRLRDNDGNVLDREGTVQKLMTDPAGFDDLKQQIMQAMTHGHLKQNKAWDTAKTYWKEKLGLNEAVMVSLSPITSPPLETMESRWAKLSGIPEEHINLRESITDMDDLVRLIDDHAGQITDRFGADMASLYDDEPDSFATEQPDGSMGRIDRSEWLRRVGSAELALEERLQDVIAKAIQEVEMTLHSGGTGSVGPMGRVDSDSDGALDADELRSIADDLEE